LLKCAELSLGIVNKTGVVECCVWRGLGEVTLAFWK